MQMDESIIENRENDGLTTVQTIIGDKEKKKNKKTF